MKTTKQDVQVLLENFDDYVNPAGDENPWFTLDEINQQFAWDDIPDSVLEGWLSLMVDAGKVENQEGKWRWLS